MALAFLLVGLPPSMSLAQAPSQQRIGEWSEPRPIPNYNDPLWPPYLVADSEGRVHAFNVGLNDSGEYAVMIRRWSLSQGWSSPVDVILPGFLGLAPSLHGVYLDHSGVVHLIYFGGGQSGGSFYYTRADISEADRSRSWSSPEPVGVDAADVAAASLIGDGEGRLLLVYGGDHRGPGLYEVHSVDGGETWSEPEQISPARGRDLWPGAIWVETDADEAIHVVWDIVNTRGLREEIRYARSDFAFGGWENETVIATAETDQELLGAPSIISNDGELIVVYQDAFPPTKYVRRSEDGGRTWSAPARPFPHIGGYGFAFMVKDSAGSIHLVVGNRLPNPEIHGMWYSRWVRDQWLPLEPITSGPSTLSFDPCCPSAVVSQGNVLLATWTNNVRRENSTGAWYSYMLLAAPALPTAAPGATATVAVPPPTETLEASSASGAAGTTAPRSTDVAFDREGGPGSTNPAGSIFLGVSPVVLLLVVLLTGRSTRSLPARRKSAEDRAAGNGRGATE